MGYRVMNFRGDSSEAREFREAMEMTKEGMRMAKRGFEKICELSEEMSEQYGERGSYGERYGERGEYGERGGYSQRGGYSGREWDDMYERRGGGRGR